MTTHNTCIKQYSYYMGTDTITNYNMTRSVWYSQPQTDEHYTQITMFYQSDSIQKAEIVTERAWQQKAYRSEHRKQYGIDSPTP
jgi:hypothetical protein